MNKSNFYANLLGLLSLLFIQSVAIANADLKHELNNINVEIKGAEEKSAQYNGGLIKTLVELRIELLNINKSMLHGKIISKNSVPTSKPNEEKANQILQEIMSLTEEIESKKKESSKYSGGLIKVMLESAIATIENNIAMLKGAYYKSKYDIYWVPTISPSKDEKPKVGSNVSSQVKRNGKGEKVNKKLLIPIIIRKRFQESDVSRSIFEESIWFDIEWDTSNLPKPIRAIKGVMVLSDLFDEEKFKINWTINHELSPGQEYKEEGVGFKYNQFIDAHKWVRQTDVKDMKSTYRATSVIYQDGSTEKY